MGVPVAPIFLTGMMASGKSTVGRLLATRTGAVFIELDDRVERMFGKSVAELFAHSESTFRACEHAAFTALLAEPSFAARDVVVATGGGLVLDPRHRVAMAACGRIVRLLVDVPTLVERVEAVALTRPLLAGVSLHDRIATLADEREEAYRDRALSVDAAAAPEVVVDRIVAVLGAAS
jgi:shikimate kinase